MEQFHGSVSFHEIRNRSLFGMKLGVDVLEVYSAPKINNMGNDRYFTNRSKPFQLASKMDIGNKKMRNANLISGSLNF